MNYRQMINHIRAQPIFSLADVLKWFPQDSEHTMKVQLSRYLKHGKLISVKRGVYLDPIQKTIDPYVVVPFLKPSSYISVETVLNAHQLIPDIPMETTGVTTGRTTSYQTPLGRFSFSHIDAALYFGFYPVTSDDHRLIYQFAEPEKALLDYLYLRGVPANIEESRIEPTGLDQQKLKEYARSFPKSINLFATKLVESTINGGE